MTRRRGDAVRAREVENASRVLRIALPGLTRAVAESTGGVNLESVAWLATRASQLCAVAGDWRGWLLEDLAVPAGILARFPAGPCIRATVAGDVPAGTWACATPVHLLTAIDHLQLAPPGAIALEVEDAAEIGATLREHFAEADFAFIDDARGAWLWTSGREVECASVEPEAAVGRNAREVMPAGRDGLAMVTLMNEIQMLLHEHPVNERRVARGEVAANSLWLWGFGRAGEPATRLPQLVSDDRWLQGFARLHGVECGSLPDLGKWLEAGTASVAAAWTASHAPSSESLADLDRACFRPARNALARGLVDRVDLLLGRACFRVLRRDRWRVWRRARPLAEMLP